MNYSELDFIKKERSLDEVISVIGDILDMNNIYLVANGGQLEFEKYDGSELRYVDSL